MSTPKTLMNSASLQIAGESDLAAGNFESRKQSLETGASPEYSLHEFRVHLEAMSTQIASLEERLMTRALHTEARITALEKIMQSRSSETASLPCTEKSVSANKMMLPYFEKSVATTIGQICEDFSTTDEIAAVAASRTESKMQYSIRTWRQTFAGVRDPQFDEVCYYHLQESVYDACVLAGLDAVSLPESVLVICACILNFLLQGAFLVIAFSHMSKSEFNEKLTRDMKDWRALYAHDITHANAVSEEPLTASVCGLSHLLMSGQQQAALYLKLYRYGIRPSEERDSLDLPEGVGMCWLALTLWLATVTKELLSTVWLLYSVWSQPHHTTSTPQPARLDQGFTLQAITWTRIAFLYLLVLIPRMALAIALGITGVWYLVTTSSMEDLVLNAMALEVVLNADELLFHIFVPRFVCLVVRTLKPLPMKPAKFWPAWLTPAIAMFGISAVLVAQHILLLLPVIHHMQDAAWAICGGDIKFTSAQMKDWQVYVARVPEKPIEFRESHRYRAVYQAAFEAPAHKEEQLYHVMDAETSTTYAQPFPALEAMDTMSLEELADLSPSCSDLGHGVYTMDVLLRNGYGVLEKSLLPDLTGKLSIRTCQDAEPWCSGENVQNSVIRFYCPVTCGCDNASLGTVLVATKHGCPSPCAHEYKKSMQEFACNDMRSDHPAFLRYKQNIARSLHLDVLGLNASLLVTRDCKHLSQILRLSASLFINLCDEVQLRSWGYMPLHPYCPLSCGCKTDASGSFCPQKCLAPEVNVTTAGSNQ